MEVNLLPSKVCAPALCPPGALLPSENRVTELRCCSAQKYLKYLQSPWGKALCKCRRWFLGAREEEGWWDGKGVTALVCLCGRGSRNSLYGKDGAVAHFRLCWGMFAARGGSNFSVFQPLFFSFRIFAPFSRKNLNS